MRHVFLKDFMRKSIVLLARVFSFRANLSCSTVCKRCALSAGAIFSMLALVGSSFAQTVFLNFNTVGQYTNNFSPWNDTGGAGNGGNYSFEENTTVGIGGTGGVQVYQSTDMTAAYSAGSWNISTNTAAMIASFMLYANGQSSGDKIQFGVMNSHTNGLNSNPGVDFETYRFIPAATNVWTLYEQYRSTNVTTSGNALGNVSIIAGHWYKFIFGITNVGGVNGTLKAGCALIDFGANGETPGTNVITFPTAITHGGLNLATNSALYPALRAFEDAGIGAWDNFLVYTPNSAPVITLPLANVTAFVDTTVTFTGLADGPGPIYYSWYTNGTLVAGATSSTFTTSPLAPNLTNVTFVASNSKGSVTSTASVTVITPMTPIALTGYNLDVVIESNAAGPPYNQYAAEFNPGEGTCFYQSGLPGTSYGLPASGVFNSAIDLTQFEFQPYTTNNALVMSSDTGVTAGTLTLLAPATFSSIAILANSGSASPTSTGTVTLLFADGSTYQTNYDAADWFFNPGFALQGVDRIDIDSGGAGGGPTDPRFYQTTINLAGVRGTNNAALVNMTFTQAPGSGATGVYAVSGLVSGTNAFSAPAVTNGAATQITGTSAFLGGGVASTGGYVPTVTIYYGTNDGGTNVSAWSNSISLGYQTAGFGQVVSNLAPGQIYYFSAQAMNIAGVSWATPSEVFRTLQPSAAQIVNVPATNVTAGTAQLAATVLNTGNNTPVVTIFYGTTNGGTNAANWASNINLGLESGYAAVTVPDLVSNTQYYFTAQASNAEGIVWAAPPLSFTTSATNPPFKGTAVLTYHGDNTRLGVNTNESQLTLANVNTNSFGQLFTYSVDGFVYAQPLIMTNVAVPGKGLHNILIVATENDSVYAFDADNNQGPNANPIWKATFINAAAGVTTVPSSVVGSSDITPTIGITSTPVIDPVTGTVYAEVKTAETVSGNTTYVHRLHALDIATGLERTNFNSPAVISCTNYIGTGSGDNDGENPAHILWNPLRLMNRPALLLLNGNVYISYASHGDNTPYHGWLLAYNATNVAKLTGSYNSTPSGSAGGFWDGGGGPSVDAQGNFYLQTGNGTMNGNTNLGTTYNYAMSILKFTTSNNLTLADYFSPSNAVSLSDGDQDLGSSAPLMLPDSAGSAAHPHLLVGGGKTSPIYLVDRDNMGRFNGASGSNRIVQQFNGGPGGDRDITPAFFNNTLYIIDYNSRIGAYKITNAVMSTTPVETPDGYDNKGGATACISANGSSNAVMWVIYNTGGETPTSPCVLRAYNATNIAQELYSSAQLPSRDSAGDAVKFTIPTIANGKVYVGAQYSVTVYGLGAFLPTPSIQPDGGSFTNRIAVSFSESAPGASFYYTTDGTAPSQSSTFYTGPFTLTNDAIVQVIAVANGAVSGVASASFINSSAYGTGSGLTAAYFSNQIGTFIPPATLTRTDAVVNFNWNGASPAPGVGGTNFSVRWTGSVEPRYTENYTFNTFADAGVRLYINGQLIINAWTNQTPTLSSATIPMVGQQLYNIEMDYYYGSTGDSVAQLSWDSPSTPEQIIPQSQLYPTTNPPPSVVMVSPSNGAALTGTATITLGADAASQANPVAQVAFYIGSQFVGAVTNPPFELTQTGVTAGSYALTAVATDTTGVTATSPPVNITVSGGSGLAYGITNYPPAPAFYNMPPVFTGTMPALLSQTGVFSNTPAMAPAASLIPYLPNTPLWSDGAQKVRYLSVPNNGAPYAPTEQISFAPTGAWSFPAGTIFVKTFELLTNQSDPTSLHRLETRLLVRDTNGAVYGVTYKWRADHSDADLLYSNLTESIPIQTPTGVITQNWYYPSPSDCLQCHTAVANYVLGVNTRQLNNALTYSNGIVDNELRAMNRAGMFNPAFDESSISNMEALSAVTNPVASFEQRARSYLDANCAQCHQPGGSGPTFDARYDTPLASQNIINTPAVKGNLGYDHMNIVTPSDVWRSSIYDRMNTVDPAIKMPTLARNLIDTNAVALMAQWINSLGGTPALPPPTIQPMGGTFQGYVSVSILPPTNGASIYFTLDGSLPTTNSQLYTGPFTLTNNATVSANAWETGYVDSVAPSAQFTILPGLFFLSPGGFTNGVFQMAFAGPVGSNYVLQVSADLMNWTPVSTNTPGATPFVLSDPGAPSGSARFYRVVEQP